MYQSNFDKFPEIAVSDQPGYTGWQQIVQTIENSAKQTGDKSPLVLIDVYPGADIKALIDALKMNIAEIHCFDMRDVMLKEEAINEMVEPFVTEDPVFGYMSPLALNAFFDPLKLSALKTAINNIQQGLICVFGTGAALIDDQPALLVYADMPRWEIQLRFRRNMAGNLGIDNANAAFSYQYKRAFFVDWRVCDRHKTSLFDRWDFVLDTTHPSSPKMVEGAALMQALEKVVTQPFRVVPFFDPGPWGGQWLKEVCDLDRSEKNFAWGFDCVPEENSLLLRFGNMVFETPAINLVFSKPQELLGKRVYEAFGAQFPIRFDFLDTMEGGNLSLQVHPLKEYIRKEFGMPFTQDESYYFLESENSFVYLGLKEGIVPEKMMAELSDAQENGGNFDADQYVEKWPVAKHDHVLIPAGTVHCSGADSVVLEISATPYIFTFKLWDWGRMGLDGKPRPISLKHGAKAIQWDRTTTWTKENILNRTELIAEADGWTEERTGLHEASFIETRRHWFNSKVPHNTGGSVNILNLVEGREAIVESPTGAFKPFIIHYAETFIVPAAVGDYTIRPYGESEGKRCATIKAFVRSENLIDYRIN